MQYESLELFESWKTLSKNVFVMCREKGVKFQLLFSQFTDFKIFKLASNKSAQHQPLLQNARRQTILEALEKRSGNKLETAKELGLHRNSSWRKMKKYGLI